MPVACPSEEGPLSKIRKEKEKSLILRGRIHNLPYQLLIVITTQMKYNYFCPYIGL